MDPITAFKAKRKLDKMKSKMEKGANSVEEGSCSVFMLFSVFNIANALSSVGILGCSIYLFIKTEEGNAFNISFLIIGVSLLLFSILALKLRRSIHLLGFYLCIIFLFFLF